LTGLTRRELLASTAIALLAPALARAAVVKHGMPWKPGAGDPPDIVKPGPWRYFSDDEGKTLEAIVDRLIPPDPQTPGGKDLGCAVFIDRQLAGPYGHFDGYYMSGPFHEGTPQQGIQSPTTPAQHYRQGLAALDRYCRATFNGATFADLPDARKDEVLTGLEKGSIHFDGVKAEQFFKHVLKDTQDGFLADPIYGGNKDMAAWKMIGFPGARYDYRDWVDKHNQRFPLPPVGIAMHPDWSQ